VQSNKQALPYSVGIRPSLPWRSASVVILVSGVVFCSGVWSTRTGSERPGGVTFYCFVDRSLVFTRRGFEAILGSFSPRWTVCGRFDSSRSSSVVGV